MANSAAANTDLPSGLPDLPSGWKYALLGDIVDSDRGISYGIVQPGNYEADGVPIIRVNDIRDGRINPTDPLRVSAAIEAKYARTRLRGGEILLTLVGTVGESALVPVELKGWNVARAVAVVPVGGEVSPDWVYLCLRSRPIQHLIHTWCTTTVQATFNLRDVARLPIPIPPRPIRERITHVLRSFDNKIELNRRTNETLEAMARALFKSWFIDFDPVRAKAAGRKPSGLDSVTAALFPASFETSSFGKTPKGWKVCTVPDAFEVNPTRSLSKGQIAPYLEMANMPTSSARALAWQYREFGSGMRFINGDVLIARITPCLENGKTAYVDFLDDGQTGWGSTEYIVLRSKPPLPTTCAYFLARNDDFRAHVIRNMTGTSGRQRAPAECLNKYFVVIPSEKIAQHFGEVIAPMLKVMKTNDEQSTSLVDACDALFPRLLSGDIDITATSAMK